MKRIWKEAVSAKYINICMTILEFTKGDGYSKWNVDALNDDIDYKIKN